jgi:hypothetical protein
MANAVFKSKAENKKSAANAVKGKSNSPFFKPIVQPKLTIGPVNDPYEREADAVADKVMRMSDTETLQTKLSPIDIQRKCAHCEEEEKLQMKGESNSGGGMIAPAVVSNVVNSPGQSLDAGTRGFMESRFGYDFGNVKVHNDSLAHQSSSEINALAYTHGNHVVFGEGQYQPNSNSGKQLLAHELAHVVQQDENNFAEEFSIQRTPDAPGKAKPAKAVVSCPTVSSFETIVKSSSAISDANGKCRMELGYCPTERGVCGSSSTSGTVIKATVDVPKDCTGELGFKQNLLSSDRKRTLTDKTEECVTINDAHADGGTPWKGCKLEITKLGQYTLETDDCPTIFLGDDMTTASAKDSFKMFLLWKKTGEKAWKSIANITWAWNASTSKKKGKDCKSNWNTPAGKSVGGKGAESAEMPVSEPDVKSANKWSKCGDKK